MATSDAEGNLEGDFITALCAIDRNSRIISKLVSREALAL